MSSHPEITSPSQKPFFGGIEGGGTKFNCMVASGPGNIVAETQFPTTTPGETLARAIDFLKSNGGESLAAIGLANFGPLDLNPNSASYGFLKATPKAGWSDTDLLTPLKQAFRLPIGLDTDVNGAAYGEFLWGAAQGLSTFIYLTIGTGIGGGIMVNGSLLHGQTHPEAGHILIPHDRDRDPFEGICPFHQDCFEGLASGPAIQHRWGIAAETLEEDHPAWLLEAEYIAKAVMNYLQVLSPQRIILGGGVMRAEWLFPLIRKHLQALMGGYLEHPNMEEEIDSYIVPPALGNRAGILGAIALAKKALGDALP